MTDSPIKSTDNQRRQNAAESAELPLSAKRGSLSMHDDVPVWYDCCSCEAEPYWLEQAEALSGEQKDASTPDNPSQS